MIKSGVKMGDVTVKRVTLNNAKFMIKNKIGVGAIVEITRAGEIIPKILRVIKPGKVELPSHKTFGEWKWDASKTNIRLVNPSDNEDANIRRITRFFSHMKIDFIKEGTVRKLYEAGFTSIVSILRAEPKDLMKAEGIKETGANKLYNAIQVLFSSGGLIPKLMAASGHFPMGMGSKRIAQIQKLYPNLLSFAQKTPKEVVQIVSQVPTFNTITAKMFAEGIYKFASWFKKTGIKVKKADAPIKAKTKKLANIRVSWTTYRDKDQEKMVEENGGEVVMPFSLKNTTVLLYSDTTNKISSKIQKAKDAGIKTMTWQQFSKKYGL